MSIDVKIVEANHRYSDQVGQLVYDLLSELYADQCHSKDIGEKLIGKAKDFACERSWEVIEVGAPDVPRCQKTVNFYLKNGFAEIGPRLELHV